MKTFEYARAESTDGALAAAGRDAQYLAGGTTLLDLMKIGVMQPDKLIDINALDSDLGEIAVDAGRLTLGALVRMSDAADHPIVRRDYPAISDALWQAASPQLRNMASLAGNVLQRTRCNYFRDVSWPCNKREPGSGCSAMDGVNRRHAVLGTSDSCIAAYPGDLAHVLAAFGAEVHVLSTAGERRIIPFEDLHRLPGDSPHVETNLAPGELITAFTVPAGRWTRRSLYLKIRDRASYEFAMTSAVVGLHLEAGTVREARVGIGGCTTKPWRSLEAEAALQGRTLDEATAREAAEAAFAQSVTHGQNEFKPELGRRTLVRALLQAAAMEV